MQQGLLTHGRDSVGMLGSDANTVDKRTGHTPPRSGGLQMSILKREGSVTSLYNATLQLSGSSDRHSGDILSTS